MKTKLFAVLIIMMLYLGMLAGCVSNGNTNNEQPQGTPSADSGTNNVPTDNTNDSDNDASVIRTERIDDENSSFYDIIEYYENGNKKVSTYAGSGLIQHVAVYDADERLIATEKDFYGRHSKNTYKYNEKDLLTEQSVLYVEDNSTELTQYEYDADGRTLSEKNWENDVLKYDKTYKYDTNGNLIEEKQDNYDYFGWRTCEYDVDSKLIKMTYLNEDGSIEEYWTYEYNSDGQMTLSTEYDAEGNPTEKVEYEYSNGELVKETESRSNGYIRTVYDYENGSVTKKTEYLGDMVTKVEEY